MSIEKYAVIKSIHESVLRIKVLTHLSWAGEKVKKVSNKYTLRQNYF